VRSRPWSFGLPRALWIVQLGSFLNYFGWGCVMPFEVIYLHDGRGFSLGVAGLVVGVVTGLAVVGAPISGPLIDRLGSRGIAVASLLALGAGFAGLAFADTPPKAFVAAAAAGLGNGGLQPSQSALVTALVGPELRHRATAVSRVASNLGIGLGGVLGGVVAARGLGGFVALFLINALTYVLYALILVVGVREDARPEPIPGGYRVVLRDRPFVRLAILNVAVIAVGWGVFSWVVPAYAREIGVSTRLIGFMVLANAITVVLAQIPAARIAEGRRRVVTMALGAATFVGASLLVIGADAVGVRIAGVALLGSAVIVALGECLHTTVLIPLVADLAPAALRGRYMAVTGLSWWLGLALAPTLAAQLLSVSPPAAMVASAVVAAAAVVGALALEREIPPEIRLTPHPKRTVPATAIAPTDTPASAS
jgi:MFS family permease